MIRSFRDKDTKKIHDQIFVKRFSGISRSAQKRLEMLDAAISLSDLATPGSRLEALHGDREGQHSIRINDQYRICFRWVENQGAYHVEITDYH